MKTLMTVWILSVMLTHGEPVVRFQVKDCSALSVWTHRATAWAERSGIKSGPVAICYYQETKT